MITAKEAYKKAKGVDYHVEEALKVIESKILEASKNGNTKIIIRENPYAGYLMDGESKNPDIKKVLETLRDNGFTVYLHYYEGQFVDYGLAIEWSEPKDVKTAEK